jgi:hypothetical protein
MDPQQRGQKMKYLITILLLIFSLTAWAGDSGLYHNPDRNGEGILLQRNGDTVVTFLFTYGAEICGLPIPPIPSPEPPVLPDDCQPIGQRWFLGVNDIVGNVVSGILFATNGAPGSDPVVGEEIAVGTYTMVRDGAGWLLAVNRFGPELDIDDPLFAEIFDFSALLFSATD